MEKMSSGRCIMVKTLSAEPPKAQTLLIAKLQKGINRMNLKVYQDQCPYAVLDDLLAADKREESFQATEMVDANYSPPSEPSSYVFQDGTFLCFLNKKRNTIYGVLMRDVTQGEECGTCLLGDMTFESYTYQDFSLLVLQRAAKRFDQQVYSTQARVIKYMKALIVEVNEDPHSMEEAIQKSIAKYTKGRTTAEGAPSTQRHDSNTDNRTRGEQKKDSKTEIHGEPHPPLPPKAPNPSVPQEGDVSKGDENTEKAVLVNTEFQSGNMKPRQGVVDEDRFRFLSRKVEVLTNEVIRMSNAPHNKTRLLKSQVTMRLMISRKNQQRLQKRRR
jgi:hypothetical protein